MAKGKKTPRGLKVLAGTIQPCRDKENPPEYDLMEEFPPPPAHFGPDAVEMWNDVGPKFIAAKVLQVVDLYALEQLCSYWERVRAKMKSGADTTATEQSALKSLFCEFGMTPASRSKVSAGGKKDSGNKFAANGRKRA